MKHSYFPFMLLSAIVALLLLANCNETSRDISQEMRTPAAQALDMDRLQAKAEEARQYCQSRNLNTDFFILIDLGRHSGLKRFFIWDFNTNRIAESYLVSHGACDNPWSGDFSKDKVMVSNVNNSHCSSVGKYILGERGPSSWGIRVKYLMHGQEPTNSNATKRDIVFHSWEQVSDEETFPAGTPEGWGCPAISNNAMRAVDQRLKASGKKTLMWMIQ